MKNKRFLSFFCLTFLVIFLFSVKLVLAGDVLGISEVDSQIALKAVDPRTIIVRIINIFLGLLSIIAVSLVIYGGFVWMTSEGNEEKVSKAKKILKNAVIGLIIVLAAWGIVTFIFRSLFPGDQTTPGGITPGQTFFQSGLGAIGACTLESVYPAPRQKAVSRNTMIVTTFKEEVATSSINSNSVIICPENNFDTNTMSCSQKADFSFSTNDNKTIVFTPNNYLGNENTFTDYIVYLTNEISRQDDELKSIFDNCSNGYFLWDFEVSNVLDLSPPKVNSIFPQPDNDKDVLVTTNAISATASLNFLTNNLDYNQPSSVVSVTPIAGSVPASVNISNNYSGAYTSFRAVIDSSGTKAQLFGKISGSSDVSLGAFDIITPSNAFDFTNYFILLPNSINPGNSWDIEVKKRVESDAIFINSNGYYFTNGTGSGFNVKIGNDLNETVVNLVNAINDNDQWVEASMVSGGLINLVFKIAGSVGNSVVVHSPDISKISFTPFSGGVNKVDNIQQNDKKDKPMNSIIQINFNEAINPLSVSGEWDEVQDTIRVRNLADNSLLTGRFMMSSNYKTVEFRSDYRCGVNACGEDIFCLPADSNLRVEIISSPLFNCDGDNSLCNNKNPFSNCSSDVCTNNDGKFYPLSDIMAGYGVMDVSANSFDGNEDGYSSGPINYYYKNNPISGSGDNLYWSFWINDQIDTSPPQIISISPGIGDANVDLWSPVKIGFNKLMMTSTLRTGGITMGGSEGNINHRLVNLLSGQLVGYWIGSENIDTEPLDGEPDKTNAYINHAQFYEGASYSSQVGSGVKDIYQNCFKPSVGLNCSATAVEPYCCDSTPTSTPCISPY